MTPFKCLPKLPISRRRVVAGDGSSVTGGDLKREALAVEVVVALPVLAPVPRHGLPASPGPFDGRSVDITRTTHIGYEDQVEVGVAINGEPYASPPSAGYPTKTHHQSKNNFITISFNK